MKKGKFPIILFALILMLCCIFGLSACGFLGKGGKDHDSDGNTGDGGDGDKENPGVHKCYLSGDPQGDDEYHWWICGEPGCGKRVNEGKHEYDGDPQQCYICGKMGAHEHSYKDKIRDWDDKEHWFACDYRDFGCTERFEANEHTYNEDNIFCEFCGYIKEHAHQYSDWILTDESHRKECLVKGCGQSFNDGKHDFSKGACECGLKPPTEGLEIESKNGMCYVTGLGKAGDEVDIIIPSQYNGETVRGISTDAFKKNSTIKSIFIPDSCNIISDSAFEGCSALESVRFGANVKQIGEAAFRKCKELKEIVFASQPEAIAAEAFSGCSSVTTIVIPNSNRTTSIGDYAFEDCTELVSLTILGNVRFSNKFSFDGCDKITYAKIRPQIIEYLPNSLKSTLEELVICGGNANEGAFKNFSALEKISIDANEWVSFGSNVFAGTPWYESQPDGVVYISNYAYCYKGELPEKQEDRKIVIKDGTTVIANNAFSDYGFLYSVTLPDSIKRIDYHAFSNVYLKELHVPDLNAFLEIEGSRIGNLEELYVDGKLVDEIVVPDNVTTIDSNKYSNLTFLKSVVIPEGVTSIGYSAFSDCTALKSVKLPSSLVNIESYAFDSCRALTDIELPQGLKFIKDCAFNYCTSLTKMDLPEGLTFIGSSAFSNCVSLMQINLPSTIEEIESFAFYGCVKLYEVGNKSQLNIVCGSENYGMVGYYAKAVYTSDYTSNVIATEDGFLFYKDGNEKLLLGYNGTATELNIDDSVTEISDGAFSGNQYLTKVTLPKNLKVIGEYAFEGTKLTEITVPASVEKIKQNAFANCTMLKKVVLPAGLEYTDAYNDNGVNGSAFYECVAIEDVTASINAVNVFWYYNSIKKLTLNGGEKCYQGFIGYWANLEQLTLPDTLREIEEYAISDIKATVLTIPAGVTKIHGGAFRDCKSLLTVNWNAVNCVYVEDGDYNFSVFYGCYSITTINIGAGVKTIPDLAFHTLNMVCAVNIPNSVESIGAYAFCGCESLATVTGGQGVEYVGESAFDSTVWDNNYDGQVIYIGKVAYSINRYADIEGYAEIEIEAGTVSISNKAFLSAYNITSISVPSTVKHIGDDAFSYMRDLETLTLNDGLESIGEMYALGKVTRLVFPSTVTSIGNISNCSELSEIIFPEGFDESTVQITNCPNYKGKAVGNVYLVGDTLTGVADDATFVVVPSTVKTIADGAFCDVDTLKYVYIPESVTSITADAFDEDSPIMIFLESSKSLFIAPSLTILLNVGKCTEDGWIYSNSNINAYIGVGGVVTIPAILGDKAIDTITNQGMRLQNYIAVDGGYIYLYGYAFLQRTDITKLLVTGASLMFGGGTLTGLTNLTEIVVSANTAMVALSLNANINLPNFNKITLEGGYGNYCIATVAVDGPHAGIETLTDAEDVYNGIYSYIDQEIVPVVVLKSALMG